MKTLLTLLPLLIVLTGCQPEPEPGSQCSTKVLTYEEMAQTSTNTHFNINEK